MYVCGFWPSCSRYGNPRALRAARRGRRAPAAMPLIARRFARRRDHLVNRSRWAGRFIGRWTGMQTISRTGTIRFMPAMMPW